MRNYYRQKGFSLILVLIAIVIIAVIFFGARNWRGQLEQGKQTENKAASDLKAINKNLEQYNQDIKNSLENNQ